MCSVLILINRGLDFIDLRPSRNGDGNVRNGDGNRQKARKTLVPCAVVRVWAKARIRRLSGGNGEGVPPVPIPNTEVKPFSADGTWLVTARESRSPPVSTMSRSNQGCYDFLIYKFFFILCELITL